MFRLKEGYSSDERERRGGKSLKKQHPQASYRSKRKKGSAVIKTYWPRRR